MIITSDDIMNIKPIASNLNTTDRLDPYIQETEDLDIVPNIGADLYQQLTTNSYSGDLNELLNGGYYEDCNLKITKKHSGLKIAIAYLAYSRFLVNNRVNVTAFGVVTKRTQYSDPMDELNTIRQSNETKKIGEAYLEQVIDYLKNIGFYNKCKSTRITKPKFRVI